jgi:hypothetical protein
MLADCGGFAARAHTANQVYPRCYRLKDASIEMDFVNVTESASPGLAVRRGFSDSERVKSKPGTPMNTARRGHQYMARLLASADNTWLLTAARTCQARASARTTGARLAHAMSRTPGEQAGEMSVLGGGTSGAPAINRNQVAATNSSAPPFIINTRVRSDEGSGVVTRSRPDAFQKLYTEHWKPRIKQ